MGTSVLPAPSTQFAQQQIAYGADTFPAYPGVNYSMAQIYNANTYSL